MNKILVLLILISAGVVQADPSNNLADLRNMQVVVPISGDGSLYDAYPGAVLVKYPGNLSSGSFNILGNSSLVYGQINSISGINMYPYLISPLKFQTPSTVAVYGTNGSDGNYGLSAVNGLAAYVYEGGNLTGTSVNGGNGGASQDSSTQAGNGGEAYLYLDGSKTAWNTIEVRAGDERDYPSDGTGGNGRLILNSTQVSGTLNVSLTNNNQIQYNYPSADALITVTGTALANLTFSIVSSSWNSSCPYGPSLDFHQTVASDASIDEIVLTCLSSGIQYGNLNVAGSCESASSGTQADIATLASYGWSIANN